MRVDSDVLLCFNGGSSEHSRINNYTKEGSISDMKISTGRFMKQENLTEAGEDYRILRCWEDDVTLSEGGTERKFLLELEGLKPLILNSVNIRVLVDILGNETDDWPGSKICAFADKSVSYGGKTTGGVRLRQAASYRVATKGSKTTKEDAPF
jgi:hypothetical protein|tara:strand:+ start:2818 stop:3276 length:459 start_codon:yes stop_codon:yes gene_type:complete